MMDFINGDIDILVATTIIESGIDIPNVNTEIIIDADKFGVSQLYQLRGRVGRSNRLAYAYLMHKKDKVLSEVAQQRLRAIRDFTEFGAGFKIAMRDLEIRGAGNILGQEQSGHLVNIGYELYCKLVDDAVRALNGEATDTKRHEANIDINMSAYIPDSYISDEVLKLSMYKKIAAVETAEDEEEIRNELIDRFGDIPKATEDLIKVARLRSLAESIGLIKVTVRGNRMTLKYPKKDNVKDTVLLLSKKTNNLGEAADLLYVMSMKAKADA
jgi:transcription-repair coupling factor (superfamily II helicase)